MLWEFINNYNCKNFIIQTFNINHHVYKSIVELDIDNFWHKELKFRKQFQYPPFTEVALLIYKTEIEE